MIRSLPVRRAARPAPTPTSLWHLVARQPLPRLHVISDVHREFGAYELPPDLDFDILVAAGDIGEAEASVKWLAQCGKPVVYVMGNHEFYGREFDDVVKAARAAARGTRVKVLERTAVTLQGVRFLGTTLWTSFGDWHPGLVQQAYFQMNDYRHIRATRWHGSPANLAWLRRHCRTARLPVPEAPVAPDASRPFHPAIAYREHLRSMAWLRRQLDTPFDGPTVVVTHHAPTLRSLEAFGIDGSWLRPAAWSPDTLKEELRRVAAYASPLDTLLAANRDCIDLWVHGHLHAGLDVIAEGVRVLGNPRGYPQRKRPSIAGLLRRPIGLGTDDPPADDNPHPGRSPDFDWRLIVDLEDGLARPLDRVAARSLATMRAQVEEAVSHVPYLREDDSIPARSVREAFARRVDAFDDALTTLLAEVAGGLDAGTDSLPLDVLNPPPARPTATRPEVGALPWAAHAPAQIALMRAWIVWTTSIPGAAATALREWEAATLGMLRLARELGVEAHCVRLPTVALRSLLHSRHHSLYASGTPAVLSACGARLAQACRQGPRKRTLKLEHLDRAIGKRLPLLSLEDLDRRPT